MWGIQHSQSLGAGIQVLFKVYYCTKVAVSDPMRVWAIGYPQSQLAGYTRGASSIIIRDFTVIQQVEDGFQEE